MPTGQLIERPFKAKLSVDGQKHPVTRGLPGSEGKEPSWGRWFRQVEVAPARGRVLMNGADERPLLVLDRKDQGPGRAAAVGPCLAVGARASKAAGRTPISCAGCCTG